MPLLIPHYTHPVRRLHDKSLHQYYNNLKKTLHRHDCSLYPSGKQKPKKILKNSTTKHEDEATGKMDKISFGWTINPPSYLGGVNKGGGYV
jgi:hypothetical protein